MLRWAAAAAAAVVLALGLTPAAFAAVGPGVGNAADCEGAALTVTVCAEDSAGTSGSDGKKGKKPAGASRTGTSDAPKCTYTKVSPQPPKDSIIYREPQPGKAGAVYEIRCGGPLTTWRWIADGDVPGAPTIDPEVVARRAVDSMKLLGPKVASPRPAGTYVVGMPLWMWVGQTSATYGPDTATATAGGVTVTATATVSAITWDMGDGTGAVVCHGPGTRYRPSMGRAASPDCGHVYQVVPDAVDGRFHGTATATWTVDWQVAGNAAEAGQFTEVRQSVFAVEVHEAQVLN
ncbi:ATP/GTP-binding protein [Streptomyces sp. NPDC054775]